MNLKGWPFEPLDTKDDPGICSGGKGPGPTSSPGNQYNPKIYGDVVIWEDETMAPKKKGHHNRALQYLSYASRLERGRSLLETLTVGIIASLLATLSSYGLIGTLLILLAFGLIVLGGEIGPCF